MRGKLQGTRISIHAPREGGDGTEPEGFYDTPDFNPRPPRGGRLDREGVSGPPAEFQSTPPARGATEERNRMCGTMSISIHAPREGGDRTGRPEARHQHYFNPRPPRGGRRRVSRLFDKLRYFNPRPPRGGRLCFCAGVPVILDFNPRPPRGGRRPRDFRQRKDPQISIHAPREGGDSKDAQFYL